MKVWRIHIKPSIEEGLDRKKLLEFCQKEKLIGVGWTDIKTKENSEEAIRREAQKYDDPRAAIKALNSMRKIQIDDLIWTRLENVYYLCRVTGLWENRNPNEQHLRFDISNYVNVEWLRIGAEQEVPGKVVSSFRPPAAVQSIAEVEDISMYLWNMYSKIDIYSIKKENIDFWTVLSAESIEELVLLYLQVEKGFHIYSSTVKYAFPTYECQMVNNLGVMCFPQVKSGKETLNAENYMEALCDYPNAEIYLFAVSEQYTFNDCGNIKFLYRKEIEKFILEHKEVIPKLTKYWIKLCGFFE
ncbi:MAG TPA: hypothetical protein DCW44_02330 [Eubacterium sp.]|nr:hypothetical protein [Eubacterium sp.]